MKKNTLIFFFLFFPIYTILAQSLFHVTLPKAKTLQAAESFEKIGNSYESITEHFRAREMVSKKNDKFILSWKIASLYADNGNFLESHKLFLEGAAFMQPDLPLAFELEHLQILAQNNHAKALEKIKSLALHPQIQNNFFNQSFLRLETARWFYHRGMLHSAKTLLQSTFDSKLTSKAQVLQRAIESSPSKMSPWNLLYAIIPGGVFYRFGEFFRGSLSFFTVSTLTLSSVWAFNLGSGVTGTVALLFAIRYYLDSVIQSSIFLRKRNENLAMEIKDRILHSTGGRIDFRRLYRVTWHFPKLESQ